MHDDDPRRRWPALFTDAAQAERPDLLAMSRPSSRQAKNEQQTRYSETCWRATPRTQMDSCSLLDWDEDEYIEAVAINEQQQIEVS